MEKKTMDTLRTMICGELDDIAKKGISDHETLDVLKDLLDSAKNIEKIEKYKREKEEKEMSDMRGYSQKSMGRYYIDGEYDRGNSWRNGMGNSYRDGYGIYDMGNSYRGYPMMYDTGNSYGYREPMGYSGAQAKEDMMNELRRMMSETSDEKVIATISEVMNKVSK